MKHILLFLALLAPTAQADIFDIKDFSLEQYQGKVIYLDFWASWCKPCRKSFPWMNQLQSRFPASDFTVVTINLDQKSESMHRFLENMEVNFDIYHDSTGNIAQQFQLEGMPTSFLIDRNGKVASRHIGFYESKKKALEQAIEAML